MSVDNLAVLPGSWIYPQICGFLEQLACCGWMKAENHFSVSLMDLIEVYNCKPGLAAKNIYKLNDSLLIMTKIVCLKYVHAVVKTR